MNMKNILKRLKIEHIFRGTTEKHYKSAIDSHGYYCANWDHGKLSTSFSLYPLQAMQYASYRAKENGMDPLLIALPCEKYVGRLSIGQEFHGFDRVESEIIVSGKISPQDIIEIKSLEKLLELCKSKYNERVLNSIVAYANSQLFQKQEQGVKCQTI